MQKKEISDLVEFKFQGMTPRFLPLVPGWMTGLLLRWEQGRGASSELEGMLSPMLDMGHLRHLWDEQEGWLGRR